MEAPRLPSIFKQNRAREFNYKPLYYDERKERIEEMRKKYQKSEDGSYVPGKISFRDVDKPGELKQSWQADRQKSVRSSNRNLILILVGLLLITYYIITY